MPKFRVTEVCTMRMSRDYYVEADSEEHIRSMDEACLLWDMVESQTSDVLPAWVDEMMEYASGPYIDSITEVKP